MNKFLAAAAFAFLGGCSMTPELDRPEPPVPASWAAPAEGGRQATAADWQALFPDPRLQALIAAALDHNRDLRIAVARVEEARAQLGIARADRFPTVNATGSRAVSHLPGQGTAGLRSSRRHSSRSRGSHRSAKVLGRLEPASQGVPPERDGTPCRLTGAVELGDGALPAFAGGSRSARRT